MNMMKMMILVNVEEGNMKSVRGETNEEADGKERWWLWVEGTMRRLMRVKIFFCMGERFEYGDTEEGI